jgi:hypothetical protein
MYAKIVVISLAWLLLSAFAKFDDNKLLVNNREQANNAQQENSCKKLKLLSSNIIVNNSFSFKEPGLSSLKDYDQSNFYYIDLDLNHYKHYPDFNSYYISEQREPTPKNVYKNVHEIRQQKFLHEMNQIPYMLMMRNRLNNHKNTPYIEYIYHINIEGVNPNRVNH